MDEGTLTARADDLAKPGSRRYHEIDVRVTEPVARTSSTHPGDVAQLGERLVCNQEVGGSIPLVSTKLLSDTYLRQRFDAFSASFLILKITSLTTAG